MNEIMLNGERLKEIGSKNPTAEAIALHLSMRQRMRERINIWRLRQQFLRDSIVIRYSDFIDFWKAIESEGLGQLEYGQTNSESYFYFNCDPASIGIACLEGKPIVAKQNKNRRRRLQKEIRTGRRQKLGAPLKLSIDIPQDISDEGLERLIGALKSANR